MAQPTPRLPEGARLLDASELAVALATGDHEVTFPREWLAGATAAQIDTFVIKLVDDGALWAVKRADGQLAFRPVPGHPVWGALL